MHNKAEQGFGCAKRALQLPQAASKELRVPELGQQVTELLPFRHCIRQRHSVCARCPLPFPILPKGRAAQACAVLPLPRHSRRLVTRSV